MGQDLDLERYSAENFRNSAVALKNYHKKYPDNAGPFVRLQKWVEAALRDEPAMPHADDNMPGHVGSRRSRRLRARVNRVEITGHVDEEG